MKWISPILSRLWCLTHLIELNSTTAPITQIVQKKSNDFGFLMTNLKNAELSENGILVNSLKRVGVNVQGYKKVVKNVWCTEPVSQCNQENSDKYVRGKKATIDEHQCLKWLDLMKPQPVVYDCSCSLCHSLSSQSIEINLRLESSDRPFIWVIREGDYLPEFKK